MESNKEVVILPSWEALDAVSDDSEDFTVVEKTITGAGRWSIYYDCVLKRESDGKFFYVHFSEGATEMQDESPFEYETEVKLTEVFPVTKTVTVYE